MVDFRAIEKKWQKKWKDNKVFQVDIKDYSKKKYYLTTPYPYMSGLLHLGHLFTYVFPETISRFKRMTGHNVLFKYGFHCTGTPIVAAAQRVKEGEQKQIDTLKKMGIDEKEISKFSDPEYWIKYFPKQTLQDLHALGFSIDERYTFFTTSLNPPYDAFIRWQFNKLKEKGYVKKGKHPVVWCPKDNMPVGDHARSEGEGETPQEFCLFKFKLDDGRYLITATLRPDTVMGITNVYTNPEQEYNVVEVKDEIWILGEPIIPKLKNQEYNVKVIGKIKGIDLVGKKVETFTGQKILVLPATFLDINYGTGMVHSVPSDSADDLIALRDLQNDDKRIEKYNLNKEEVKAIKPIHIFDVPEIEGNAAEFFLKKYNVKNQNERDKLEKIKKELYKLTFAKGKFNKLYKGMKLDGKLVSEGQDKIKKTLIEKHAISLFYELTGKVVCRCLTDAVVKIVSDQWFIEYNDEKWKKITHKCLDNMRLYPDVVRKQFDYVLDWLNRWACAREFGLGTRLPWDENWVIESLSDSTLQMAYNTISKYLQHPEDYGFSTDKLNDIFFDYVFLAKGKVEDVVKSTGINKELVEQMKKDFDYWYPFDFRNSAKDLIQNHLGFCLFNHTALFPEKHWPKAYALNGRIMVNNEKMSKSKGNFFTIRELYEKHSADIIRITAANAGEGIDDANFDMTFLETAPKKLNDFYGFAISNYGKGRDDKLPVDDWFESVVNDSVKKSTSHLDDIRLKSALLNGFLDMQRNLKWYTRRTDGNYNKKLIDMFIESQIKILAPFTPHFCEEVWEAIGKKSFVSDENWPEFDGSKIDEQAQLGEDLISCVMTDVQQVLKLAKVDKPKKIILMVSPGWKYIFMDKLRSFLSETRDFKQVLSKVMSGELKQYGKDITKLLPKYIKVGVVPSFIPRKNEISVLNAAKNFLEKEYSAVVEIVEKTDHPKQKNAMPSKPAILVE